MHKLIFMQNQWNNTELLSAVQFQLSNINNNSTAGATSIEEINEQN